MNLDVSTVLQWLAGFRKPYPGRDWAIVAGVSLVLMLCGLAFAGYLFWGVQTGAIISAAQQVPRAPIPVSRDAIKKVLETYSARATNYAAQNFVGVNLTDPRATSRR